MNSRWQRWREWNRRTSTALYEGDFGESEDAKAGFAKHPYAMWYLLIPIAGFVFFVGVVWEENLNRRRRELNARIAARERRERMYSSRPDECRKSGA